MLERHRIEPEPSIDGPLPDGTPEQIRRRTTSALFEIASKLLADGPVSYEVDREGVRQDRKQGRAQAVCRFQADGVGRRGARSGPAVTIEDMEEEEPSKSPDKRPSTPPVADNVVQLSA